MITLTKEDIRKLITNSCLNNKPIAFEFKDLKHAFGFKRMSGENVVLAMLITGKSEDNVQTLPDYKIHENIKQWCNERLIKFSYDEIKDLYIFI